MRKSYRWMIGLTLLSFVMTGFFLTLAPDTIPVHYNAAGEIDRWGSKYEFLLFPILTLVMGLFMGLVARHEGKKGENTNALVAAGVGVWSLVLFNAIWLFFFWKTLAGTDLNGGEDLEIKGIFLLLLASFLPLGNQMPKARRNSLFGLRTKWSMADDVCWQKSQRLGGFLLVGTGIAGIVLVSLIPAAWASGAVMVLILSMMVAATVGTYVIWKKEQEKSTA